MITKLMDLLRSTPEPKTVFDKYAVYSMAMSVLHEIEKSDLKPEAMAKLPELKEIFRNKLLSQDSLGQYGMLELGNSLALLKLP